MSFNNKFAKLIAYSNANKTAWNKGEDEQYWRNIALLINKLSREFDEDKYTKRIVAFIENLEEEYNEQGTAGNRESV